MADNVVDSLELQVKAQAQSANTQLELLCKKLSRVQTSLAAAQSGGLSQMARGVSQLSAAMNGFSGTKTAEFTRLAKNLNQIANVNAAGIRATASAIQSMNAQLAGISGANLNVTGLAELANGIGRLGGAYVTQASNNLPILRQNLVAFIQALNGIGAINFDINGMASLTTSLATLGKTAATTAVTNIPLLANALKQMMTTLSTAPVVSQNLINMTNALAGLAAQGARIPSVYNRMTSAQNVYTKSTKAAHKASTSFAAKIGKLYATYFLVARGMKALWSSITKATDYVETLNYFDVTVNKVASEAAASWKKHGYESAEAYYKSFRDRMTELTKKFTGYEVGEDSLVLTNMSSLGMNVSDILNYQATYLQMADSMGVVEETAYNVSSALTMLAGDWSSLKNIDLDVAMKKMSSALVGQTRAVRELGIDTLQATLQEYAYKHGIDDSVTSMTQAAKVQLRMLAMLDQSKVAYGDLAKTVESPANQVRILANNFQNLTRTLGSLFLPIVQTALPYVNGMVIAMNRLLTSLGNLIGVDWSSSITSIGSGVTDDMADLGDEIDGAAEAAEKFNKATRAWDELNVMNESKSGSAGADTSTGGYDVLDEAIEKALTDYRAVWNEAFEGMENKAEGIADKIGTAFVNLKEKAQPTIDALKGFRTDVLVPIKDFSWGALETIYKNFFEPVATWVMGEGLPEFITLVTEKMSGVSWSTLGTGLSNFASGAKNFTIKTGEGFINFLEKISPVASDTFNAFLETLARVDWVSFGTGVGELAFGLLDFGADIANGFLGFMKKLIGWIGKPVGDFLNKLGIGMGDLGRGLQKIPDSIGEGVGAAIAGIFTALVAIKSISAIKGLITTMSTAIPLLFGLVAAHPYAAIAVAVGALFGALSYFNETPAEKAAEAMKEMMKAAEEAETAQDEFKKEMQEDVDEGNIKFDSITIMAEKWADLSSAYDTLDTKQRELVKFYAEKLSGSLDGIVEHIDPVTGAYKGTREELEKLIETQRQLYLQNAYSKNIESAYSNLADNQFKADESQKEADRLYKQFKSKEDELNNAIKKFWNQYKDEGLNKGHIGWQDYSKFTDMIMGELSQGKEIGGLKSYYNEYFDANIKFAGADARTEQFERNISEAEELINYWQSKLTDSIVTVGVESQNYVDAIISPFAGIESSVVTSCKTALDEIDKKIEVHKQPTKDKMKEYRKSINKALSPIKTNLPEYMQNTLDGLDKKIEGGQPGSVKKMTTFAQAILTAASGSNKPLSSEKWLEVGKNILNGITASLDPQALRRDAFEKYGAAGMGLADQFLADMEKMGSYSSTGLSNGISSGAPSVTAATKSLIDKVISIPQEMLSINSPSKLMESYGEYIDLGLAAGIDGEKIAVLRSMQGLSSDMVKSFEPEVKLNVPDLSKTYAKPTVNLSAVQSATANIEVNFADRLAEKLAPYLQQIINKDTTPVVNVNPNAKGIVDVTVEANRKHVNRTGRSLYA